MALSYVRCLLLRSTFAATAPRSAVAELEVVRRSETLAMKFTFGESENERVAVDVLSYERPICGDYHDDNWLVIHIAVSAGGFSGTARATILTDELVRFAEQLHLLYDRLTGSAAFSTLEGQLSLTLVGDGRGHIRLTGDVSDQPGVGNQLSFTLDFDQSQLQQSIRELDAVITAFPIRSANA